MEVRCALPDITIISCISHSIRVDEAPQVQRPRCLQSSYFCFRAREVAKEVGRDICCGFRAFLQVIGLGHRV